MDMVEDSDEGEAVGDLVSEGVLLPGPMWVWEGEDCPDVGISSAELLEDVSRRTMRLMVTLGVFPIMKERPIRELCNMVTGGHLREWIHMFRK